MLVKEAPGHRAEEEHGMVSIRQPKYNAGQQVQFTNDFQSQFKFNKNIVLHFKKVAR